MSSPFSAGLGQADDFFEPRSAGAKTFHRATVRPVNREFIATRIDAQLEIGGQAVLLNGKPNDGEVVIEFSLELHDILL